jgi:CBS domain containing-hemolysin-like protein
MSAAVTVVALLAVSAASFVFSTLSYALRDLSRVRFAEALEKRGRTALFERTLEQVPDLIFITAVCRLLVNFLILLLVLHLLSFTHLSLWGLYGTSALVSSVICMFCAVAIPHSLARHAGDSIVAATAGFLQGLRTSMLPFVKLMNVIDDVVRRATGASEEVEPEEIEQEILSAVEEGQKEGIVDPQERAMIESVIAFRDTTAGQIMTARPEIIGVPLEADLLAVKKAIEESGHSRLPVYEGTLDHVTGILYARDLLAFLGENTAKFNIRSFVRPAFYVPESKPVGDLLHDFRLQKVHIAVVLDEYSGTAGIVTIEDIFEELVGDISDEHEPIEPAMFTRIDDQTAEADARLYIDELNRLMSLGLPEDAGYDTLGGFVSTTLGRIPATGTTFEFNGTKFRVLDAEPQKVNRVRIELVAQPVTDSSSADAAATAAAPTAGSASA